jgi:hypothetical protein
MRLKPIIQAFAISGILYYISEYTPDGHRYLFPLVLFTTYLHEL